MGQVDRREHDIVYWKALKAGKARPLRRSMHLMPEFVLQPLAQPTRPLVQDLDLRFLVQRQHPLRLHGDLLRDCVQMRNLSVQ